VYMCICVYVYVYVWQDVHVSIHLYVYVSMGFLICAAHTGQAHAQTPGSVVCFRSCIQSVATCTGPRESQDSAGVTVLLVRASLARSFSFSLCAYIYIYIYIYIYTYIHICISHI